MDFGEGMKKVLLAGIGAMAATADSAKDIVEDLVKKGELTVEQGKVVNEELKHKAKQKLKDHVHCKCCERLWRLDRCGG